MVIVEERIANVNYPSLQHPSRESQTPPTNTAARAYPPSGSQAPIRPRQSLIAFPELSRPCHEVFGEALGSQPVHYSMLLALPLQVPVADTATVPPETLDARLLAWKPRLAAVSRGVQSVAINWARAQWPDLACWSKLDTDQVGGAAAFQAVLGAAEPEGRTQSSGAGAKAAGAGAAPLKLFLESGPRLAGTVWSMYCEHSEQLDGGADSAGSPESVEGGGVPPAPLAPRRLSAREEAEFVFSGVRSADNRSWVTEVSVVTCLVGPDGELILPAEGRGLLGASPVLGAVKTLFPELCAQPGESDGRSLVSVGYEILGCPGYRVLALLVVRNGWRGSSYGASSEPTLTQPRLVRQLLESLTALDGTGIPAFQEFRSSGRVPSTEVLTQRRQVRPPLPPEARFQSKYPGPDAEKLFELLRSVEPVELSGEVPTWIEVFDQARWISEEDRFSAFCVHLLSPLRRLPLVVLTTTPDTPQVQGDFHLDPDALARRLCGLAHVVCLSPKLTFMLTNLLGRELSVFSGGARVYEPGFDPTDDPRSHRLYLGPRKPLTDDTQPRTAAPVERPPWFSEQIVRHVYAHSVQPMSRLMAVNALVPLEVGG